MKKLLKPLLVLVVLAVLIILFYNIYVLFNPDTKTQIVSEGTIEEKISGEAMIIRDETVILQKQDVIVSSALTDGDRVAKGTKIADLYYGDVASGIRTELLQVTERIKSLEALASQNAFLGGSMPETLFAAYATEIMNAAQSKDMEAVYRVHENVENAINRKIVSDEGNTDVVLRDLRARQSELEKSITGEKDTLYTDCSGVYFSSFDGYEGLVSTDSMFSLTPTEIQRIKNNDTTDNSTKVTMKIADGYVWYAAIPVHEDKLPSLKKGAMLKVRFPHFSQETYDVEVQNISKPEKGQAVVLVCGTTYNEAVYYNRFMDAELILNSYTGLKFLKDAVKVKGNQTGVYVVQNDGTAAFKPIEVLATDSGYTVVKEDSALENSLKIYDEVIITDSTVKEGEMVPQ